jgi:hypothetical protein
VTNCIFIGNNYGMVIDQTKVQQQVLKNLFLNNRIAVFLRNLSGNNQHEVSDNRMETSQPNSKGIYAINVAPPANGFLLIKGNRIQNATQGIHLLNTKGANIAQDSVFIRYKIPGGFPNCGVLAESCEQTSTNKCTILAPNSQTEGDCSYGCEGIRFDLSNNSKIACNHIVNSCDALVMLGSQTRSTTLTNNIMQESFRGIYLGAVRLGTQGQPNFPQDNQWLGNISSYYIDVDLGPNSFYKDTIYYRSSATNPPYLPPSSSINATNIANLPVFLSTPGTGPACTWGPPVPPAENAEAMVAAAEAIGANDPTLGNAPDPWQSTDEKLGKESAYHYIKDNPWGNYSPVVVAFADSMEQEDLGMIDDIKRALSYPIDTLAYSQALGKTALLSGQEEMEQLYREVLEMALSNTWLYKNLFTDAQVTRLREIAAMCPREQGRAVFAARVLLTYVDQPLVDYRNACEVPTGPSYGRPGAEGKSHSASSISAAEPALKETVSLFPNPTTGACRVYMPQPGPGFLEVFDLMGQRVFCTTLQGKREYDVTLSLAKGMYQCKISQKTQTLFQTKLVVQ